GADADDTAVLANEALDRCTGEQCHAVLQRNLRQVMVVNRPQDRVAMAKGLGISILHAEQAVTVAGKEAAFHEAAFPGKRLHAIGSEDIRMRQVFTEVNATRPVLGAGEWSSFDG